MYEIAVWLFLAKSNLFKFQARCSEDGFSYVVGYVKKKLRLKFPELQLDDCQDNQWIKALSRGGLNCPSTSLVDHCTKLEERFQAFHGDTINMDPKPIERLFSMVRTDLSQNNVVDFINQLFLKVRFFNRISWLNSKLQCSDKIRSLKQYSQHKF